MYKHILVATDGSKLSMKALKAAASLAADLGARLSCIYVKPEYTPPLYGEGTMYMAELSAGRFKEAVERDAKAALAQAAKVADDVDVPFKPLSATGFQPWESIVKTARARKCDLVVMASHGRRGLSGFLLGSETTKVLTHSKVPVLVVR